MKRLKGSLFLTVFLMLGSKWVMADTTTNPVLSALCSNVSCLNNFTAKTGWSFSAQQEYSGGFTDLEQTWYLSPAPGFDVPIGPGVSVGNPNLDINLVFKAGKLLSDKVTAIHNMVNNDPFLTGLMKYATIGESGAYDYSHGRWYDLSWVGATITW
jgi:hypothetical protein